VFSFSCLFVESGIHAFPLGYLTFK